MSDTTTRTATIHRNKYGTYHPAPSDDVQWTINDTRGYTDPFHLRNSPRDPPRRHGLSGSLRERIVESTDPASFPSNDHLNGDRNREPHRHSDGGYALRQRWI